MKDNSGDTRDQILDAAKDHFAEYGYRGASISKIAELAGVSKSLIFWYFDTKESLFKSLVERFIGECITSLDLSSPPGNARSKIEYLIDTYWQFIRYNFKFVRIFMNWFMQVAPSNKQNRQRLTALHYKFREVMEHYLKQGIKEELFRQDLDIKSSAQYIVCCLEGIVLQVVADDLDFKDLEENFLHNLKKNLFHGLLR